MSRKKKATKPAVPSVDKAFLTATGHTFLGAKLQPYTPSRIVAAQAMGLIFPRIGREGTARLKKRQLYAGELKDIIIVLWLCRLKTKELVEQARMDPVAAYDDAEKWAGKAGIVDMTSDVFLESLDIFQTILNEVAESKTQRSEKGSSSAPGGDEEDETDPKE